VMSPVLNIIRNMSTSEVVISDIERCVVKSPSINRYLHCVTDMLDTHTRCDSISIKQF
jgi:predicted transcriptional regulator